MQKTSNFVALLLEVGFLVLLDQLLKLIFINGQLLSISCNSGIGFGLSLGRFGPIIVSSLVLIAVLLCILYLQFKNIKRELILPLGLIAAGALSNLIDRIARGCIVDYINFRIWPSFNLADLLITLGLIWATMVLFSRTDS